MEWQFRSDLPIYTQLTQRLTQAIVAGGFVTEDVHMIENAKFRLADKCVADFLSEMAKLGCSREEVLLLLQGVKEEEK